MSVKIPQTLESAGFGAKDIRTIADAVGMSQSAVIGDIEDAIESGCRTVEDVIGYIKPMPLPPGVPDTTPKPKAKAEDPAPLPDAPTPKATGFNLGSYVAQMSEAHEASLLPPGRYVVTVADTRIGSEANDIGLIYGLLICTVDGHPNAEEVPIFAAVDVDDDLKTDTGLAIDKMDPIARARFLGGLKTVEKLIKFSDVTAEELAEAENAEEALTHFIGTKLKVVLAKSKDQNDLPCNKIKSIVGRGDG